MLFQRRTLQLRVVKVDPDDTKQTEKIAMPDPVAIGRSVQESIMFLAVTYVGIRAATTVLDTAQEIAIITAKAKIN